MASVNRKVEFQYGLYNSDCDECGEVLAWELNSDPRSYNIHYTAECCGNLYKMKPVLVEISKQKKG